MAQKGGISIDKNHGEPIYTLEELKKWRDIQAKQGQKGEPEETIRAADES